MFRVCHPHNLGLQPEGGYSTPLLRRKGTELVSFETSHAIGIISGLTETFIKRYIVERTNMAEIIPEE